MDDASACAKPIETVHQVTPGTQIYVPAIIMKKEDLVQHQQGALSDISSHGAVTEHKLVTDSLLTS